MPTGYTSKLYEGEEQSFEDFVLSCARAFGALILMRDDPADAPIPDEFPPSNFYREHLEKSQARVAELLEMTDEDADHAATASHMEAAAAWDKDKADREAKRERYAAMLAQVRRWKPPTAEHKGLKDFMVEQLESSIKFDCGGVWKRPVIQSGQEWRAAELERARRSERLDAEQWAEEQQRAAGRTAWVKALRDSLGVSA